METGRLVLSRTEYIKNKTGAINTNLMNSLSERTITRMIILSRIFYLCNLNCDFTGLNTRPGLSVDATWPAVGGGHCPNLLTGRQSSPIPRLFLYFLLMTSPASFDLAGGGLVSSWAGGDPC